MVEYGWSRLRDENGVVVDRGYVLKCPGNNGRSLDFTLGVMSIRRGALSREVTRPDWHSLWINLATVWRMGHKRTKVEVGISQGCLSSGW